MEKQLKGKDLVVYLMTRFDYTLKEAVKTCEEKNQITAQEAQELKNDLKLPGKKT